LPLLSWWWFWVQVKLVRVNKRIQEAYCAELYLTKVQIYLSNK
jgi:hypothetical protein